MTNRKIYYLLVILLCLFIIWQLGEFLVASISAERTRKSLGDGQAGIVYTHFSKLDGMGVATLAEETPRVVGVMIDNHPAGRPASGLALAKVVYEAPAEGGITRYFAIFNASSTVSEVGPVRSARPYFLDWINEYGIAPYLHSGGSPEALALLKKSGLFDVNEFWRGRYFWRDAERSAPHNLYTNSQRWQELIANEGGNYSAKNWEGWRFVTSSRGDGPAKGRQAFAPTTTIKAIKIPYSPDYTVEWKFSEANGRYERLINGLAQKDKDGASIVADNILVQFTNIRVLDELGRKEIITIGKGEGRLLNKNEFVRGTWQKKSPSERTRWYNEAGNEVSLVSGVTWVQVVPSEIGLEVTN